jgi:hypothetical protein
VDIVTADDGRIAGLERDHADEAATGDVIGESDDLEHVQGVRHGQHEDAILRRRHGLRPEDNVAFAVVSGDAQRGGVDREQALQQRRRCRLELDLEGGGRYCRGGRYRCRS